MPKRSSENRMERPRARYDFIKLNLKGWRLDGSTSRLSPPPERVR